MSRVPTTIITIKRMADSIEYKKPANFKSNLAINRRNALREFYKIQQANQQHLEKAGEVPKEELEESTQPDKDELTLKTLDGFLKTHDIEDIVAKENEINEVLNANQNEIKSIIYNNYYELIKINHLLASLKDSVHGSSNDALEDLSCIKKKLGGLQGMNWDIELNSKQPSNLTIASEASSLMSKGKADVKGDFDSFIESQSKSMASQLNDLKR